MISDGVMKPNFTFVENEKSSSKLLGSWGFLLSLEMRNNNFVVKHIHTI